MVKIPIRTDVPLSSRPWMNWLLILLNLAVFLLQDQAMMARYMLSSRTLHLQHFVTYAFLHLGLAHLAFNMLVLYALGNNINDRLGHLGYLAFYLAGAVFSGIGFVLTGGQAMVGASGAVGAVMGAYLAFLPRASITFHMRVVTFEIPGMYFIILFFLYNLFMSFASFSGVQQVAYEAHLAGMLFGFTLAMLLLATRLVPRHPFDLLALLTRWRRRQQYRRLVRDGYDPFSLPSEPAAGPRPEAPDPIQLHTAAVRAQVAEAVAQRDFPRAAALYRSLRSLDPRQILPRQALLDIANQLASEQRYTDAADAYEQFLQAYPGFDQIEQIQLMLGLIYARYLQRYARAGECLTSALARLQTSREIEMARTELQRIHALLAAEVRSQKSEC